jgi:hypothetical protein
LTFIFAAFGFTRVLTSLLAILSSTISTSSMDDDFDCLLAPVTASSLSLFHFDNFNCKEIFTWININIDFTIKDDYFHVHNNTKNI